MIWRRERWVVAGALLLAAAIIATVVLSTGGNSPPRVRHAGRPSRPATGATAPTRHTTSTRHDHAAATTHEEAPAALPRMLGQMIIARFSGTTPSASLLARIRAGEVGGIILFTDNVAGGLDRTELLTADLQSAAREGGNPPLLIMTDQEGGGVRRLPGPPALSAAAMTSDSVAFREGAAAGQLLRRAGVNVDLAPVADVEQVAGSFLATRSFGTDPSTVAKRACAFAAGLASARVAYTLKHFPGLGFAKTSTDVGPVSVEETADALRADYRPYQVCGTGPMALVMVSSAIYPTLSGPLPAVMSPAIYQRELPLATQSSSTLTISDDLQTPAIASQLSPARRAIDAGLDVLLYAETEHASADAYARLLAEARRGLVSTSRIAAANRAIAAIKRQLAK
jgi:beta-N-acetylhexosaminidase